MLSAITQHPWLLGSLSCMPILALFAIGLWTVTGPDRCETSPASLDFVYWLCLVLLAGCAGSILALIASALMQQNLVVSRFLIILCSLPGLTLFIFKIFDRKYDATQAHALYEWLYLIGCWIVLPLLIVPIWSANFTSDPKFLISVGSLSRQYLPWFVLFWTSIFSFLSIFAFGMGGEMLYPATTFADGLKSLLRPLLQFGDCLLIAFRSSFGLTSLVIVVGESIQTIALMRG